MIADAPYIEGRRAGSAGKLALATYSRKDTETSSGAHGSFRSNAACHTTQLWEWWSFNHQHTVPKVDSRMLSFYSFLAEYTACNTCMLLHIINFGNQIFYHHIDMKFRSRRLSVRRRQFLTTYNWLQVIFVVEGMDAWAIRQPLAYSSIPVHVAMMTKFRFGGFRCLTGKKTRRIPGPGQ